MGTLLLRHLCIIGLLSGLLGVVISATPQGRALEENFGLFFLFKIRGHRHPPAEAVVLAIENESAEFFRLKQQPYKWPRTLHGKTIDMLTENNVTAIGLDMFFEETRSIKDDEAFAEAIRRSGRVVLLHRLRKIADGDSFTNDGIHSEQFLPPVPVLEQAAFALAPMPLPQRPVRINQAWLFKEGTGNQATLPVMVFAMVISPLLDTFVELVRLTDPSIIEKYNPLFSEPTASRRLDHVLQDWKSVFLVEKELKGKMSKLLEKGEWDNILEQSEKQKIRTIINLFGGERSVFINYYGPPGTITTIPYYSLFRNSNKKNTPDLTNKAVFIGLTHEAEMGEKDGFYTVFTTQKGKHISGVEVAATLFSNLIDGSCVTPLHPFFAIIFIASIGLCSAAIGYTFNPMAAGCANMGLCLVYITTICALFAQHNLWSPFVIPVMLQIPLTYLAVTLVKHRRAVDSRQNFQKALQCYIPENIVAQIEQDFSLIAASREITEGICLYSDIENYTVISENFDQRKLSRIVNSYYEEMFQIVKHHSGMILDIRGDAMLALWPGHDSRMEQAEQACSAALSISHIFNISDSSLEHHLATRIGLHQGTLSLGNIGALDHFQYTITGDTVNTAARIESLNKQLGTKLLISEPIAQLAANLECRKIGRFLFVGKSQPLTIYEPIGGKGTLGEKDKKISYFFSAGLEHFEKGMWQKSLDMFQRCILLSPEYGPALWFQRLCEESMANPDQIQNDGVIRLTRK